MDGVRAGSGLSSEFFIVALSLRLLSGMGELASSWVCSTTGESAPELCFGRCVGRCILFMFIEVSTP